MAGFTEIVPDQAAGEGMGRDEADAVALAFDPEMGDAFALGEVLDAEIAKLRAAQAMEEQGSENGSIAFTLEGIGSRRIEESFGLLIADSGCQAFAGGRFWSFDAVHGIVGDGVSFGEMLEQGGEGGEFAADGAAGQLTLFQVIAPGDDMGPGDAAHVLWARQADKAGKILDIGLIGAFGLRVFDIGEPFGLGRDVGQALEFRPR